MSSVGSGDGLARVSNIPLPPSSYRCPHCSAKHSLSTTRCPETGEAVPVVNRMHGHVLEGKYRVIEMLARGGMGIVYTGIHETTGRRLAIKFIHPEASRNKRAVQRFENEARIAAMVRHRNIRTILDVGTTPDGVHYIVMEYLDGESLAEVIDREHVLPLPEALAITGQILSSLKAVNAKDVVHRDLKPDNVFLASETGGTRIVKVLDFGLSRLASAKETMSTRITRDGTVVGTPMYMAPEQARGARRIDHRADLFSVGIMLYRMVTGEPPFQARSYNQYLVTVTTTDPPAPSTLREGLPAGLDEILEKALSKEPDDRYATAEEFSRALAAMTSSELPDGAVPLAADTPAEQEPASRPSPAGPPSSARSDLGEAKTITAGPRRKRRELTWMLPAGVGLLLVVSGIAGFFVYKLMTTPAQDVPREDPRPTDVRETEPVVGDPVSWQVTFTGLPEKASVYVDHVLHTERPVIVQGDKTAFAFRVTAPGFEPWQREVAVSSDLALDVAMTPLGSSTGPGSKGGTKPKPKPRPTKGKIERTFPGMGQ